MAPGAGTGAIVLTPTALHSMQSVEILPTVPAGADYMCSAGLELWTTVRLPITCRTCSRPRFQQLLALSCLFVSALQTGCIEKLGVLVAGLAFGLPAGLAFGLPADKVKSEADSQRCRQ